MMIFYKFQLAIMCAIEWFGLGCVATILMFLSLTMDTLLCFWEKHFTATFSAYGRDLLCQK